MGTVMGGVAEYVFGEDVVMEQSGSHVSIVAHTDNDRIEICLNDLIISWIRKNRPELLDASPVYQQVGMCKCGVVGRPRFDNGLPCGIFCDKCWRTLLYTARQKSW